MNKLFLRLNKLMAEIYTRETGEYAHYNSKTNKMKFKDGRNTYSAEYSMEVRGHMQKLISKAVFQELDMHAEAGKGQA